MAVIDKLPGAEVSITVKGEALTEHRDDDHKEDERTNTRYIEAVSGTIFAVKVSLKKDFVFVGDCVACTIYVDGTWADGLLISKGASRERISEGMDVDGGTKVKKYRFASLETVADGLARHGEISKVKEIGTIRVEIGHRRLQKKSKKAKSIAETKEVGILSEKVLKGQTVSHNVEFSEAEAQTIPTYYSTGLVAGQPTRAATFKFCYRSYAALKIMLIIPRTPSPEPLWKRDHNTLTPEDIKELQKRAAAFEAEQDAQIKIKREKVAEEASLRHKHARPHAGSTQLEIDDSGNVRASATPTIEPKAREIIEID